MSLFFNRVLSAFRVRSNPSAPAALQQDGENGDLSCDEMGNLWVRTAPAPFGSGVTFRTTPAVFAPTAITATSGYLAQVGGFNDSGAAVYVQLFDQALAPINGTVPDVMTFYVPNGSSFSWEPSNGGEFFPTRLWFAVSSTRDTLTIAPNPVYLYAQLTQ